MILVATTKEMIEEAARFISANDLIEFNRNIEGRSLPTVLARSLDETSRSIIHNGNVLATGGSNGCLWFVTTTWVDELTKRERVEMLKILKGHLEWCRTWMVKEQMTNFVYEHNDTHRRLLDALGATYGFYQEYSPAGHPFRQFWL
jgi:hypothetical protein